MRIKNMFNERLKEIRKLSGMTQKEVAAAINYAERNYQSLESGQCKPSFDTLIALADCFNVSLNYLVGRAEEQTIGYERVSCDNCNESVIFHFKDSNQNDYALGLSTILGCITFAIQCGDLPKLPMSWLADADSICGTEYANDNRNCYSDYGKEEQKCEKDK